MMVGGIFAWLWRGIRRVRFTRFADLGRCVMQIMISFNKDEGPIRGSVAVNATSNEEAIESTVECVRDFLEVGAESVQVEVL